jgi:SOS-response transcriptional repressor LexA
MLELDPMEQRVVAAIVQRCRKFNTNCEVPNSSIQKELGTSRSWFHKVKNSMVAKQVLQGERGGCKFTDEAASLFLQQPAEIVSRVPMEYPLLGQVQAGRAKNDDLRVDMADPASVNPDALTMRRIPDLQGDADGFLLEVKGDSMVAVGIQEGTYLVVKRFRDGAGPRQGQLIVARYLLPADQAEADARPEFDHELYEGPTVKYYNYIAGHSAPHRLAASLKVGDSKNTYYAVRIHAYGYVVGYYRSLET